MTKFVKLCAIREGFPKKGSLPQRNHNPMDLRHGPHCHHSGDPNAIGVCDCDADGFADAERQAKLWADRGLTLKQAIEVLAPPNENDTADYLHFVLSGLKVSPDTPMTEVLKIQA